MTNKETRQYGYIKTVKGYDIYSYTSFITGEIEGYIAVKEGFIPNRTVSLLKGLLAPSVEVLIEYLTEILNSSY